MSQRLDCYYNLPGQDKGGSTDFDDKYYSDLIDEQTKTIVASQVRHIPDPKKGGNSAASQESQTAEEGQRKQGPMRVTAILRSIPSIFQSMGKKTQSDLSDPNQMKLVRK